MILDRQAINLAKVVARHLVPRTFAVLAKVDEDAGCLRLRCLRLPEDPCVNVVIPGDAIRECNNLKDLQLQVTDAAKEAKFRAELASVLGP